LYGTKDAKKKNSEKIKTKIEEKADLDPDRPRHEFPPFDEQKCPFFSLIH